MTAKKCTSSLGAEAAKRASVLAWNDGGEDEAGVDGERVRRKAKRAKRANDAEAVAEGARSVKIKILETS